MLLCNKLYNDAIFLLEFHTHKIETEDLIYSDPNSCKLGSVLTLLRNPGSHSAKLIFILNLNSKCRAITSNPLIR